MRRSIFAVSVMLLMAGCSPAPQTGSAPSGASPDLSTASAAIAAAPRIRDRPGIAGLPDHGALVRYDRSTASQSRGAYTYHPIELSETHALNAATPGRSLSLTAPDGRPVRLTYQRHEESPDGNWTWIGQTAEGAQAVITFGEKAVFGRIEQRTGTALRITTFGGRGWLAVADPSKLFDGRLHVSSESDALIVPQLDQAASAAAIEPLAKPNGVVDLALGYTDGLAVRYGGDSQVNTRLSHLVALTNQAFRSSGIYHRLRLVHSMRVAYTDANANAAALGELSGQACSASSCESRPVPTGLQPLRDAREIYGADLVSLVRPLSLPQQASCGTAWIIRPPQEGMPLNSADEKFGYSVIGDGVDFDESVGKTAHCPEETLAHEIGHNLGQAHNVEDIPIGGWGAHYYSQGYREDEADGFYTIMAIPKAGSSQFSVPYFSNPRWVYPYNNRPLGKHGTSDNAQSLNLMMPMVARFRAAVVPYPKRSVRNDLNGDGKSDLFWYHPGQALMAYWWIDQASVPGSGSFPVDPRYRIAATGDFDGDGLADLLWMNDADNIAYLWRSRGDGQFDTQYVSAPYSPFATWGTGWRVVSSGHDLNEDGKDDIIWQDSTKRTAYYWFMDGGKVVSSYVRRATAIPRLEMFGSGDFDGDGNGDLIQINPVDNYLYLSRNPFGDGLHYETEGITRYDPSWTLAGVADLNGDGMSDLIWENHNLGLMAYWQMNRAAIQSSVVKSIDPAYRIAATGDYNGDGRGDILWTNASTGLIFLWLSRGNGEFDTPYLASYSTAWSPIP
ncbi:FG-GAP-like repeat-containing protein [Lysobacter sp. 5GHs7-4]|uniref:FG-GAP-like repeat-containing protein n=1 Tax=Lysobacter sp. 5GHs7-4 TaxID=2904253 RepID=UPI001E480548|nr:FG-GAP-like repeat-containing protein [Lysobacter sp. 5GHs7-4]UHQ22672.1 FG-GAP-like repeat-containing protein [Lysobacter sp. 5GHs7-4]